MKKDIIRFVSSVVSQREYLLKHKLGKKNALLCYKYCRSIKLNLLNRNRLTEIAAKKIFLKFKNEIFYLIPSGKNPVFNKREKEYQKILNYCIDIIDTQNN